MKNKVFAWVFVVLCSGCASVKTVDQDYKHHVNLTDGVDFKEAKIIAQKKLLSTEDKDTFCLSLPEIKTGHLVSAYPRYWFVTFGPNWLEPMSKEALTESYHELKEKVFIVVIDKNSGDIFFAGTWYPKREDDFNWIFHPAAYNDNNPLALPPGEASREIA